MYRMIQCYTGNVGTRVLRQALLHPSFEVVGVLVSGDAKHGHDVGELAGLAHRGVKATKYLEEILDLDADCVSWSPLNWPTSPVGPIEPGIAGDDAVHRILRSGKNVYTGVGGWYLDHRTAEWSALELACREGGVSFAAGGNIPGLATDAFPLFVAGYSGAATKIWCKEAIHPINHPSAHELQQHAGFGLPVGEHNPAEALVDALYEWALSQSARQVADAVGVTLDSFRLVSKERAPADHEIALENGLVIRKGTVAGARWTFSGFVGAEPWYTCVCELTCQLGLGNGWRQSEDEPQFTVRIDGNPNLEASIKASSGSQDAYPIGDLNASRTINMLPLICAAPPGVRSILDLPFVTSIVRRDGIG